MTSTQAPPAARSTAAYLLRETAQAAALRRLTAGDLFPDQAAVLDRALAVDATTEEVALGLLVVCQARHDFLGPDTDDTAQTIAAGLLRALPTPEAWTDICDATDEREDMLTLPAAEALEKWLGPPAGPDPQRTVDQRVAACDTTISRHAASAVPADLTGRQL